METCESHLKDISAATSSGDHEPRSYFTPRQCENHKIPIKMEKKNLTGTAKSCVHPSAQLPGILVTRPSTAPLADLRPASLGPGARESALSLKWVTLQRSTSPPPPTAPRRIRLGAASSSRSGWQEFPGGFGKFGKRKYFPSGSSLCSSDLHDAASPGVGGALWVSPPRDLGSVVIPPWTCKAVQEWMRRKD